MVTFQIAPMPDDINVMWVVASWSIEQWGADFPDDTVDTYIDLYKQSARSTSAIPRVFVALNDNGSPVGTVTFISDDELPNASEPGPWLAALFVLPEFRNKGLGRALVDTVIHHARSLGFRTLYLYTQNQMSWYESMDWKPIRQAQLSDHEVTVMSRLL